MYNYLHSLIWKEELEIQADEKTKRQKFLVLKQIKQSNFKLKPTKKILPQTPIWGRLKKSHLKISPIL